MSTVQVFRVERNSGAGPYTGCDGDYNDVWATRNHSCNPETPLPCGFNFGGGHRFGFASLDQLGAWFLPCELVNLHEHGFRVSVYEVAAEYVQCSAQQVVFEHHEAKRLQRLSMFDVLHALGAG